MVVTVTVKYFDNGVLNAIALGRYTFHRTYFLFLQNLVNCGPPTPEIMWLIFTHPGSMAGHQITTGVHCCVSSILHIMVLLYILLVIDICADSTVSTCVIPVCGNYCDR